MLQDDRATSLASLVAWGMLNTLLPLFLGVLSLIGLLFGGIVATSAVEDTLLALLPEQVDALVTQSLASFEHAAGITGFISLGLLLVTGSNLFVTLESVFDIAYHVPERPMVKQRLVSVCGLLTFAAFLLVASGVVALAAALHLQPRDAAFISGCVLTGALTLLYWQLPNRRGSVRYSLPGALIATVLLVLISRMFPLYVEWFGHGSSLYAAFGAVLLFVFWLYCVAMVLVVGAALNAFLETPERSSELAALSARARRGQLELRRYST